MPLSASVPRSANLAFALPAVRFPARWMGLGLGLVLVLACAGWPAGALAAERGGATGRRRPNGRAEKGRLYVTDLDGTVIFKGRPLPSYSQKAMSLFVRRGWQLGVATGRNELEARRVLGDVRLALPVMLLHGALTKNLETGEILRVAAVSQRMQRVIAREADRHGVCLVATVLRPDGTVVGEYKPHPLREAVEYIEGLRRTLSVQEVRGPLGATGGKVLMLTAEGPDERLDGFREAVAKALPKLQVYPGTHSVSGKLVEFTAPGANKGQATRSLAKSLGLTMRQVTGFGDEVNDLSLARTAGRYFAVETGNPALLSVTRGRLPGPQQQGVASYLARLLRQAAVEAR